MVKNWCKVTEHLGYEIQILQNAETDDELSYRVVPPVLISENGNIVLYDSVMEAIDSINKYAG